MAEFDESPDQYTGSANGINDDVDISEPIRRPEAILLFSRYFICAILLNIYVCLINRPQRKLPRFIILHSLPPPPPLRCAWNESVNVAFRCDFRFRFSSKLSSVNVTRCERIWTCNPCIARHTLKRSVQNRFPHNKNLGAALCERLQIKSVYEVRSKILLLVRVSKNFKKISIWKISNGNMFNITR